MASINDLDMREVSAIINKYKYDHRDMIKKLNNYIAIVLINKAVNQGLLEASSVQEVLMNIKNDTVQHSPYGNNSAMDTLISVIVRIDSRIKNLIKYRILKQHQIQKPQYPRLRLKYMQTR